MFDFNNLLPDNSEEDFTRGYAIASVAAGLIIEQAIKEAFPNESADFHRGVIDGLKQEI